MTLRDIALVTGARGGIGRELCRRLREDGVAVAAVGRDASALQSVQAEAGWRTASAAR